MFEDLLLIETNKITRIMSDVSGMTQIRTELGFVSMRLRDVDSHDWEKLGNGYCSGVMEVKIITIYDLTIKETYNGYYEM